MRNIEQWAADSSLYFRLRESVQEMVRGKGSWGERCAYAFQRLAPIREADFPEHLQSGLSVIKALHQGSLILLDDVVLLRPSTLTPKQRALMSDVLFTLYEEMTKARAMLEGVSRSG